MTVAVAPGLHSHRSDPLLAAGICVTIATLCLWSSSRFMHWFVVPVFVCGLLVTPYAVQWFRQKTDILDPVAVVGFYGFFFFFTAPLLHVLWDQWMPYVSPPPDWRDWLGAMAAVNAAGLLLYRLTVRAAIGRPPQRATGGWCLRAQRVPLVFGAAAVLTAALQLWAFARFGGLDGYVRAFESFDNSFAGWGWVFTVSESCPLLLFLWWAIATHRRGTRPGWPTLLVAIAIFTALLVLFGGLRGSRSHVVFPLLWAVGLVHAWFRPIRRTLIAAGVVFLLAFMYAYGFYKSVGREALRAFESTEERAELEEASRRTFKAVVLGDLGRADVQALVLQRSVASDEGCTYAWGRTYWGAAMLSVPRSIWPDRPPTKVQEGTECLYGPHSYSADVFQASNVYGLAGEIILNFGVGVVPAGFILYALVVVWIRERAACWAADDARRIFLPLLVVLCMVVLSSDLDNVLLFLVKYAGMPCLAVWLSSVKGRVQSLRPVMAAPRIAVGALTGGRR